MFKHLAKHDVILVSGPQRSGTRIAAQMIAADTGHRYVDEREYGVHDTIGFMWALDFYNQIVVHCPSMSHIVDKVVSKAELVVWMIRNLDDIRASEIRVNWTIGVYKELYNYGVGSTDNTGPAIRYRKHGGQIAPLKYAHWWSVQRDKCPNWLEIEYESLAQHELWVSKENRENFKTEQTK